MLELCPLFAIYSRRELLEEPPRPRPLMELSFYLRKSDVS